MNGAKFLLNGNVGSVSGPTIKKELPIVSSLKFIKPFEKKNGKIKWQFREYFNKSGFYVVVRNSGKVAYIGIGLNCLYRAAIRFIEKRKGKYFPVSIYTNFEVFDQKLAK